MNKRQNLPGVRGRSILRAGGALAVIAALFLFLGTSLSVKAVQLENDSPVAAESIAGDGFLQFFPVMFKHYDIPTIFGLEMTLVEPGPALTLVEALGSYWMRHNALLWSSVEPVNNGVYDWGADPYIEEELITTYLSGMHSILVIRSTPLWAQQQPGYFCGPMKPEFLDDFGDFLVAAVKRYSGPPFYVRHYEIWNEPDVVSSNVPPDQIFGCWGDEDDAHYGGGYYGEMLKAVYPRMKTANPDITVLVGGLLLDCDPRNPPAGSDCTPALFLEGILTAGAKNSFDAISFHAYDYYNPTFNTFGNPNWNSGKFNNEPNGSLRPVLSQKVDFINEVLASFGATGKILMNTESALLCGGNTAPPGTPPCDANDTSPFEILKASYLAQSYPTAIGENLAANLWFTVAGWRNSGLLYDDDTPRPAYYAFQFSEEMLRGTTFKSQVTGSAGIAGYKFDRKNGTEVWIVWAWNGGPQGMTLPSVPFAIWDSTGDPVTVTGTSLTLTVEPYYVELP
ncbi:MAG TPA: hypothetical protein VMN57_09550 [Anaerolineales bacterium]|nr:hypothetical protein [Anaerolineales bacterium]